MSSTGETPVFNQSLLLVLKVIKKKTFFKKVKKNTVSKEDGM